MRLSKRIAYFSCNSLRKHTVIKSMRNLAIFYVLNFFGKSLHQQKKFETMMEPQCLNLRKNCSHTSNNGLIHCNQSSVNDCLILGYSQKPNQKLVYFCYIALNLDCIKACPPSICYQYEIFHRLFCYQSMIGDYF